ncbi:Uncharacterised protein [uncultured archaeon]|nr:Uncharacterised protein [uncultured archaeon]
MTFTQICKDLKKGSVGENGLVRGAVVGTGEFVSLYAKTAWNFRKLKPFHDELERKDFFKSEFYQKYSNEVHKDLIGHFIVPVLIITPAMILENANGGHMGHTAYWATMSSLAGFLAGVHYGKHYVALQRLRTEMGDKKFASFTHSWDSRTSM